MTYTRFLTIVALSAAALATTGVAALPYSPTTAQRRAEQACRAEGVKPSSDAWELCLSHVTRAYEWGETTLAGQLARVASTARESCLGYGLKVDSMGYRSCLDREIDARSDLLILGDDQTGVNVAAQQADPRHP